MSPSFHLPLFSFYSCYDSNLCIFVDDISFFPHFLLIGKAFLFSFIRHVVIPR